LLVSGLPPAHEDAAAAKKKEVDVLDAGSPSTRTTQLLGRTMRLIYSSLPDTRKM